MNAKSIAAIAGFLMLVANSTFASAGATQPVSASQPVQLVGDVKVDKVVTVNGQPQHQLSEPKVVVPGDHLIFSTAYRNLGAAPVKNFVVTNPVPAAVVFAPEAADGLIVSVDGGKSWGALAQLTVADGKGGQRAAQGSDVTHVRWTLPLLAPGATGSLTYKAIVR